LAPPTRYARVPRSTSLGLLASYASFDLALEVAPGDAEDECARPDVRSATLAEPLRAEGVRGHGSAVVPSAEALAHVALERATGPYSYRTSTSRCQRGAWRRTSSQLSSKSSWRRLARCNALIDGSDPHHVLEAIFKALGTALAQACRPRRRQDEPHA
jgi:imidazoleglycerol phosphate dehydratase HisB